MICNHETIPVPRSQFQQHYTRGRLHFQVIRTGGTQLQRLLHPPPVVDKESSITAYTPVVRYLIHVCSHEHCAGHSAGGSSPYSADKISQRPPTSWKSRPCSFFADRSHSFAHTATVCQAACRVPVLSTFLAQCTCSRKNTPPRVQHPQRGAKQEDAARKQAVTK